MPRPDSSSSPDYDERLFDLVEAVLLVLDRDGRVVRINRKGGELLGLSVEEIVGRDWFGNFLPEDTREATRQVFLRLLSGDGIPPENHDNPILGQGGSQRLISWRNALMRDTNGAIVGMLCAGLDVTTRQHRLERLDIFERILANIPDHVSVVGPDYVYRLVNDTYCRVHRKPREAIEGHHVADLFGRDLFETAIQPRLDRCLAGEVVSYEDWFQFPSAGRRYMGVIYTPCRLADGSMAGVIVSARDLTEQRLSREALQESEANYRSLFENMLHGYAYCRMLYQDERPVDFVYLRVNRAFETLTRLEGVVGRRVSDVIPGIHADNPELLEIYGRVARGGGPEQFESYLPALDIWFSVSAYSHEPDFFVAVFDNISQQKRARQALIEHQEYNQLLLDSMAEGIYGVDTEGNCTFVNRAALRLLGYAEDALLGRHIHELIHHHHADGRDYPAQECRAYRAYLEGRGIHVDDEVFWRHDGSSFPVEYWSYPMRRGGEVVGSVVTFLDISIRRRAQENLFEATQMLQIVIDTVPHFVFWKDRQSRYLGANKAFARLAGFDDPAALIGHDDHDLVWHSLAPRYQRDDAQVMDNEVAKHNIIEPIDVGDGKPHWLETNKEPLRNAKGHVIGVLGVFQDITERLRDEKKLRQAAKVFESTTEGVMITDLEGRLIAVNQAFVDITGFTQEEALGATPRLLKSGRHEMDFYQAMWAAIAQAGAWQGEIWNRRKNGELYPEWLAINTVNDDSGQPINYVGVFSDISQIKQSEAMLDFLAHHDPLTGLPNRLLLNDRVDHAIQRAKRDGAHVAILFIDLDQFKTVNDSLGHPIGDQLLQQVAARLSESVREEDTVARLGGDEFVVLLEALADTTFASDIAKKILHGMARPYVLDGNELVVSGSIGISACPGDGEDATTLLRNADTAMYRAKDEGRNTFRFYSAELTQTARERLTLESEMRRALERQEFMLFFQPQVDVASGRLVGAEALVRWRHPDSGLVPPARFIPLAEETGLILPLGEWVLYAACERYQAWREAGLPEFTLAVNLSPRQFRQKNLVRQVRSILDATGMPPNRLELEITEGAIMEHGENARGILLALKSLGIKLAIDDFGTGYSSLAYLRRFPINVLKIDQSFMHDIPHDQGAMEIAATIIAMARNLHLHVLAEGVETQEQLAFLQGHGCDSSQGYLHSRPLPVAEFETLLRAESVRK